MVLRKGALALEGGQYWHLGQFRELQEFGHSLAIEDALTHVEQRILGAQQGLHGRFDVVGIRGGAPALHRRIGVRVLVVLPEVRGNDKQHRTGTARA